MTKLTFQSDLKFLPEGLINHCRRLIESFHKFNNFTCIADILWRAGAPDFVCINPDLEKAYAKAAKLRRAKRADAIYLQIASGMLAVDILSRGMFGWAKRYPSAARRSIRIIEECLGQPETSLCDVYLHEKNFVKDHTKLLLRDIQSPPNIYCIGFPEQSFQLRELKESTPYRSATQ